ncbi:MAG: transglutaminase domain-containing protein [bacterium]|nr:transglutaminase domain-containing protein [bacterium]
MRRMLCAAMVLAGLALAATGARAAKDPVPWAYPPTATKAELEAACGSKACLLDLWNDMDLHYDPARDGVYGTWTSGRDAWLRDGETLRANATILKFEGPLFRCRDIVIEVWSPATGETRRVKESELAWQSRMNTGSGIITLDEVISSALIPGLRPGDRLRIVERYDVRGMHGLPSHELRTGKLAPARQRVRLHVPVDQRFTFEAAGPDSLTARIAHQGGVAGKLRQLSWDLQHEPSAARGRAATARIVAHLAVDDAQRPPAAFAGAADWAGAAAAYRETVNEKLEPTPEIAAEAQRIVAGNASAPDRIAALYRHVQHVTRYLGLFDGRGGIIPASADQTRRVGYGDCKGMATYFIALCRAVGIQAWPVLVLATDEDSFADTQPNMGQFNHFIAWADDGADGLWIDPTLENMPPGVLVPDDAEHPVLTTRPGAEGLCRIPRHVWDPGLREYSVVGAIDPALRLSAQVTLSASGPGGDLLAVRFAGLDPRQRDTSLRELLVGAQHRATATVPAPSADTTRTRTWSCGVETALPLPGSGTRRFLPAEIAALPELIDRQPGSTWVPTPRRRADRRETWRLELPAGWRLAAADSASLSAPGVAWSRVVRQEGTELVLERVLDWCDTTITAAQEQALRPVLADIDARERVPVQLVSDGR